MLRELHIRHFALIDEVSIEFGPGLNVFTGATGVGKSLVLGAFGLLLGGRASADVVRSGQPRALVSGAFEIDDHAARFAADLLGADVEDGVLAVSREVDASGRSRCRINGMPVTVGMLKQIGERLVDIHGQHDHESLRSSSNQRVLLDQFGGVESKRDEFADLFHAARRLRERRDRVRDNLASIRQEADFLAFQVNEIDAARLRPDEEEELRAERQVLASAERLQQTTAGAYAELYEIEGSISERLKRAAGQLAEAAEIDGRLASAASALEQAQIQIDDAAFTLQRYVEDFQSDPQRLAEVEERLEELRRLQDKYGRTAADILAARDEMAARLEQLQADSQGLEPLEQELKNALARLKTLADEVTAARRAAGEKLARQVERELKDLGMSAGRFLAQVEPAEAAGEALLDAASAAGQDRVEFLISTNPGEEPMPLRRVASGGEMSRIMLAIKKCLARADRVSVFVFDEIDANIGGRLGSVVGQKLYEVSRSHQVICVTHLPQIACFADTQHRVTKRVSAGRTATLVEPVTGDARLEELAQMLRGDETTELTRAEAEEMLRAAEQRKAAARRPRARRRKRPA